MLNNNVKQFEINIIAKSDTDGLKSPNSPKY